MFSRDAPVLPHYVTFNQEDLLQQYRKTQKSTWRGCNEQRFGFDGDVVLESVNMVIQGQGQHLRSNRWEQIYIADRFFGGEGTFFVFLSCVFPLGIFKFLKMLSGITSSVSQLAYSVPVGKALELKLAARTRSFTRFIAGIHSCNNNIIKIVISKKHFSLMDSV